MEFKVTVEGVDYNVQTSKGRNVTYLIDHKGEQYEMVLSDDNEWVGLNIPSGSHPIPVDAIGLAIQANLN